MSVSRGGTALKPFRSGGSCSGSAGRGRNLDDFLYLPLAILIILIVRTMPEPYRTRQVLKRHDHSNKAVSFRGIVSRTKLQNHLLLRSQIKRLHMPPLAQVKEINAVSVLFGEQRLGIHAVLNHLWRAPFAGNGRVISQMPREIVTEILWSAIHFPLAQRLERIMVEGENSSRTIA